MYKKIGNHTENPSATTSNKQHKSIIRNNNNINSLKQSIDNNNDKLPKQFITSMKTLFDIMDDQKTGFVKLTDIEKRWTDNELPVVSSLRKVTPVNGQLSFERFCAGLRICLLRNQHDKEKEENLLTTINHGIDNIYNDNYLNTNNNYNIDINKHLNQKQFNINNTHRQFQQQKRPPSAPLLDLENAIPCPQWIANPIRNNNNNNNNNVAGGSSSIRNNNNDTNNRNDNILSTLQRTLSLPKLSPAGDSDLDIFIDSNSSQNLLPISFYGPPKPPRTGLILGTSCNDPTKCSIINNNKHHTMRHSLINNNIKNNNNNNLGKAEIRTALQNWQMGILINEMDAKGKQNLNSNNTTNKIRGNADGSKDIVTNYQHKHQSHNPNQHQSLHLDQQFNKTHMHHQHGMFQKKINVKKREPRRHTLQNGIDYNMLKKVKQLEQEKDILYQGLNGVEKAREYYLKQIGNIQEKIKYLGKMGCYVEQWSDVNQERVDLQRARVMEINRHLAALTDSWEHGGFPLHMNLAVRSTTIQQQHQQQQQQLHPSHNFKQTELFNRLKHQNDQLSKELNRKTDRITILERERQTLLHDVIKLQRNNKTNLVGAEDVIF